ncbi:MAG: SpoIIE family protein phosphatase [Sulfuricurvum sp.]|uniref:SpoIIE family protein phosphatase n=1 Tax=Sulfuricurvum sp. TaxID=2025608 RepID=UPI0025F8118E|nr:SpoIIE family protein phosphatase [Sulfuricurvum sp.]MCK9371924.1 SpoIIE family protein phosphatase [Sulfuricurvum sp.]
MHRFDPTALENTRLNDKVNYLVKLTQLLAISAIIAGVIGMLISNFSIRSLNENSLEPLGQLRLIKESFEQKVLVSARDIAEGKITDYKKVENELVLEREKINTAWKIYTSGQLTQEERELLADTDKYLTLSIRSLDRLTLAIHNKQLMEVISWTTDDAPYTVSELTPMLNKLMQTQIVNAQHLYSTTQIQFLVILFLIISISIAGAMIVKKMVQRVVQDITHPFSDLISQSNALANQKLDEPFIWTRSDEIGQVGKSFELSRQALHHSFELIRKNNLELEQINTLVRSSINYASRIQRSFLPDPRMLNHFSNDAFIIWNPKDVIGGDCYWVDKTDKGFFVAIIDCTGHGVPGALMTFVVISILDRLLSHHRHLEDPASLLSQMNRLVKETLGQYDSSSESNDGMDGAFCYIDLENDQITFAGANTPLLYTEEGHLHHIRPDKHSLGYVHSDMNLTFTNHTLKLKKGMRFYLTTDGMIDQIGGPKRIAYGKKRLMETIQEVHQLPMQQQQEIILERYYSYKGDESQRDDNTMIAFQI